MSTLALHLRSPASWLELAKFCLVGASGYVINLLVYAGLIATGTNFIAAAVGSFLVAVTNNYLLNRAWTFRAQGPRAFESLRYLTVSVAALILNLILLAALVDAGLAPLSSQAAAIVLVTPVSFLGNKLWSFGASRPTAI